VTEPGPAPLPAAEAVHHARAALEGGPPVAIVTVIDARGHGAPPPGAHLAAWADRHAGTLGSAALDERALAAAREALASGRAGSRDLEAGGAACTVYVEPHRAPPSLVIVGAGHIARPLCRVGALLGFRVTVLDDRPEFATRERFPEAAEVRRADFSDPLRGIDTDGAWLVLVTRGHKYDFEVLRDVLRRPASPAYVGMVGSRRRTRAALEQLAREGVEAERLRAVYAPVGLDVRAETPEEIAVSIAAELVRVRRGGTGQSLRDRERVAERWVTRERPASAGGEAPPRGERHPGGGDP
jgi:xanthine dehydrogenase accessory factor